MVLRRDKDLLGDGVEFQSGHGALTRRDVHRDNSEQDKQYGNHGQHFRQREAASFSVFHAPPPPVSTRIVRPESGILARAVPSLSTFKPLIVNTSLLRVTSV